MSNKIIESYGDIIERIIDLKPSENKIDNITEYELETPEDKINQVKRLKLKELIEKRLDKLKIIQNK